MEQGELIDIKKNENGELEYTVSRGAFEAFDELLFSCEGVQLGDSDLCPVKHSFCDGMYLREMTIPQGVLVSGKIHKFEHPSFLLKGTIFLVTEEGEEVIEAPSSIISKVGVKRVGYAITDVVWTTVHHNPDNETDIDKLADKLFVSTYKEFDEFMADKEIKI